MKNVLELPEKEFDKLYAMAVEIAKKQNVSTSNIWADGFLAGVYYAQQQRALEEACQGQANKHKKA